MRSSLPHGLLLTLLLASTAFGMWPFRRACTVWGTFNNVQRHLSVLIQNRFQIGRSLPAYRAEMGKLGKELQACIDKLGPEDQWFDSGAGAAGAQRHSGLLGKIKMVAAVFTRPRPNKPENVEAPQQAEAQRQNEEAKGLEALLATPEGRKQLRYLENRDVASIPATEIGKTKLITDIFGPATYAPLQPGRHLSEVFQLYGDCLVPGGDLFLSTYAVTSELRLGGPDGKVISWKEFFEKHCRGFKVVSDDTSSEGPGKPTKIRLHLQRTDDPLEIPKIENAEITARDQGAPIRKLYFTPR